MGDSVRAASGYSFNCVLTTLRKKKQTMPSPISNRRRNVLLGAATAVAAAGASLSASAAPAPAKGGAGHASATFTTRDGVEIYYKDWGPRNGPVVVFSHGWPLNSDSWESQMLFLSEKGYRTIAHDRRGHGRSSQPWDGNDMDHYADDLAQLLDRLDVKNAALFGFSTGGGEVARYLARHGSKRVAKAGLISAVPPQMLKTASNPNGLPMEVFDGIRAASLKDRSQFYLDLASGPFYNFNRPGAKPSQGLINAWWMAGMMAGHKNTYDCIKAFSETDFTDDLKKIDIPMLVLHGDDDQIVPIGASAHAAARLLKNSRLVVYPGAPHGLTDTHKDKLNADLLAFIKG
jgi:non-heme chloroperoxidase